MTYHHLTPLDRCQIGAYLQVQMSVSKIAKLLGYHRSTLYRELKRNSIAGCYVAKQAQFKSQQRFIRRRRGSVIVGDIASFVVKGLHAGYTPEQIAGRLRLERGLSICHQTVYRYVHRQQLRHLLPRHGKRGAGRYLQRRARRRTILSIDERPEVVARRERLGDWERDGMYIADRNQILVLAERKSRYVHLALLASRRPQAVTEQTRAMLVDMPVHTMTNDNGPEFRDSQNLPYPTYHCHPYKPQQRGTVENTIGRLRRYLKRTTKVKKINNRWLSLLASRLNHTPRKCLNYRTPHEILHNKSVALTM